MTQDKQPADGMEQHRQNLRLQATEHPVINDRVFRSIEEYVLYLIHLKAYHEAAGLAAGKSVLDWGCNVGYGIEVLATTASSVAGIDVSPEAVALARDRLGTKAKAIYLYDGTRCECEADSFDFVTSFQVVEHISDYDTYFGEILRVLRPGGTAIFTTPNAALRLDPGMKPWFEFHVREFTSSELRELLVKWFESVTLRGLFATDQMYAIERTRLESARRRARAARKSRRVVGSLKAAIKRCFPGVLRLRDALKARNRVSACTARLDVAELARFSLADLYYHEEQFDDALDLMAVCRKGQPATIESCRR